MYNIDIKITSSQNYAQKLVINTPFFCNEGNNSIIKVDYNSIPKADEINYNDKIQEYSAHFYNFKNKVEYSLKIEFKNKSRTEWFISMPDEKIEKLMDKVDIKDKPKLQIIARKIIKEFDNKHKDSEFEFLDFMKIGLWVKENITYDYKYSGKQNYSALQIYNMRKGVCHHFTRLSNALLYSLGYKVIYIRGNTYHWDRKKIGNHAWSLIKIGNRWYPFDST